MRQLAGQRVIDGKRLIVRSAKCESVRLDQAWTAAWPVSAFKIFDGLMFTITDGQYCARLATEHPTGPLCLRRDFRQRQVSWRQWFAAMLSAGYGVAGQEAVRQGLPPRLLPPNFAIPPAKLAHGPLCLRGCAGFLLVLQYGVMRPSPPSIHLSISWRRETNGSIGADWPSCSQWHCVMVKHDASGRFT